MIHLRRLAFVLATFALFFLDGIADACADLCDWLNPDPTE